MITLETLPQATAQEVFDQVATHLLRQNERSTAVNYTFCLYRSPNGLKCAAGSLIADEEYLPVFDEVGSWLSLVDRQLVPEDHTGLIIDLQIMHDECEPHKWPAELKKVAKKHKLKT